MKVGILTQPLSNNYGGLLQNYALQQALIGMGQEPVTLDHGHVRKSSLQKSLSLAKANILHTLLPTRYPQVAYQPTKNEIAIIQEHTNRFINQHIVRTSIIETHQGFLKEGKNGYGAFVVGSDQCWRPQYSEGFLEEMFLNFIEGSEDIKRVAYAASFGTDKWEMTETQTPRCSELAKHFDLITVREASAVGLCKDYLGVEATHVLDPTMLLTKEDYEKLVREELEPESKGNLFHYLLNPSKGKNDIIVSIARQHHLQPFTIMPKCQASNRTRDDIKNRVQDCIYPSVTRWLRGFIDAKMVVVDSFHGAVFSIIFNKPFWVFGNAHRGNARFESLLTMFHLEDRFVDFDSDRVVDWNRPIDWSSVNRIIEEEQVKSKECLQKGLAI